MTEICKNLFEMNLIKENARMSAVVEAAMRWHRENAETDLASCDCAVCNLIRAIDVYEEGQK